MQTVSVSEAKDKLSSLVESVESTHDAVVITRHGKPAAVLISPEDLDSLQDTLAWLSNPNHAAEIAEAETTSRTGACFPVRKCAHSWRSGYRRALLDRSVSARRPGAPRRLCGDLLPRSRAYRRGRQTRAGHATRPPCRHVPPELVRGASDPDRLLHVEKRHRVETAFARECLAAGRRLHAGRGAACGSRSRHRARQPPYVLRR